jgi:hypothetical protein
MVILKRTQSVFGTEITQTKNAILNQLAKNLSFEVYQFENVRQCWGYSTSIVERVDGQFISMRESLTS